jgi:WD40 repeat protein
LTLRGHPGQVAAVAFNWDGSRLASSGADGVVKVWDVATGEELLNLAGHTSWVYAVDFSPLCLTPPVVAVERCGIYLATAGLDQTARIWNVDDSRELLTAPDLESLQTLARTRITRQLKAEECQKYLHLEACP